MANDGSYRLYLQRRSDAYGAMAPAPYRGRYWVLDPATGLLLMGAAAGLFGTLPLTIHRSPSPASRGDLC